MTPRSGKGKIRRAAHKRIMAEARCSYGLELHANLALQREIGLMVAQVVDDTVSQGHLDFGWHWSDKAPTISFCDSDEYASQDIPLLEFIETQLYNYGTEEDKLDRSYRFLLCLKNTIKDFMTAERKTRRKLQGGTQ